MKKLLVLIVLSLLYFVIYAQPFYFKHYGVENGLSNNTVISIVQDKLGFMWFGTADGLNKFDGKTFKPYRNYQQNSNISSNSIYSLHEDKSGNLWIGTENGMYSYHHGTDSFTLLKATTKHTIRNITSDVQSVWFISKNELFNYNPITRFLKKRSFSDTREITAIYKNKDNDSLWLGTSDGRLKLVLKDTVITYNISSSKLNSIETITYCTKGSLLIGNSIEGLKKFAIQNQSTSTLLHKNQQGEDLFVRGILQQSDSVFFISTERGLYLYNIINHSFKHLVKNLSNPYSLSDNALYGLYKDRENGIWIGSYFGGINYLSKDNNLFEKYFQTAEENSVSGSAIREITKDSRGNMWIGSEDGGLTKYNPLLNRFKKLYPDLKNKLSNFNIHGLLTLPDYLLIGTFEHGIDVFSIKKEQVTKRYQAEKNAHQLKSNFINKIHQTSENKIIVCTSNGIYNFDLQAGTFTPLEGFPENTFYSAISEDEQGTTWIGTHNKGLFYMHDKEVKEFSIEVNGINLFQSTRIVFIMEDIDNQLWIATISGLYSVDPKTKKYQIYNIKTGFPSNMIYGIIQDTKHNYWITTSNGLVKMDYRTKQLEVFNQNNGLLNNQFNYQSVYKDDNGFIYMGSIKGFIKFNPDNLKKDSYIPPLYFTNLSSSDTTVQKGLEQYYSTSILLASALQLPHTKSTFFIEFAVLCFSAHENILYEYKINNNNWYKSDNSGRIFFTNLNPGKYTLTIRSTNGNGIWVNNERSILIEILPPFWKSPLAYTLYITLLLFVTTVILTLYFRRQKQQQHYNMQLFSLQKEKELYQSKMDFFTNVTHEIKTPLTLIKLPLEKITKMVHEIPQIAQYIQIMNNNTKRLLELTNQLLDFRKMETDNYELYLKSINLVTFTENITTNFSSAFAEKNISFQLKKTADNILVSADEEALTQIISNLIDNAIKYCHQLITVSFEVNIQEQHIKLIVTNDGKTVPESLRNKIFEPFFRSVSKETKGSGLGLALAYSLVLLHKGNITYTVINDMNVFSVQFPDKNQTSNIPDNDR